MGELGEELGDFYTRFVEPFLLYWYQRIVSLERLTRIGLIGLKALVFMEEIS